MRLLRWVFILTVFAPLAALAAALVLSPLVSSSAAWRLILPSGRRLPLFLRSVGLASGVALASMLLAVLAGTFLWRLRHGVGVYLRWFFLLMLVLPPYVHKEVWASTFETLMRGGLLGVGAAAWLSAGWVQLMSLAPVAVGLTLVGLLAVDPERIDAARLAGDDGRTLVRVVLPLAAPAILAAGGIVFLLSLTDYSIPSLFGLQVYALEIHAGYRADAGAAEAFLLSLPLLAATAAVAVLSQSRLRRASLRPAHGRSAWRVPPRWPAWWTFFEIPAVIVLSAQLIVPIAALLIETGSWSNFIGNARSARAELAHTVWIASVTAALVLLPALAVARRLAQPGRRSRLWWILVALPLAVPAPLVGIGLVYLFNRDLFGRFYGSPAVLLPAMFARFAPIAALVILAQLRRIDRGQLDAARLFQPSRLRGWLHVRLPLVAPGLVAAACIVFAFTAGELGATQMIAPSGYQTLTPKIYNYMHHGSSGTVASLCLLMTLTTLSAAALAALAWHLWSRRLRMGDTRS